MAVAITQPTYASVKDSRGNHFQTVRTVTGDTSYPTGGWPITAAQLGLARVTGVTECRVTTPGATAINAFPLIQTDGSVLLKGTTNAGVEVANASSQAALVVELSVYGF